MPIDLRPNAALLGQIAGGPATAPVQSYTDFQRDRLAVQKVRDEQRKLQQTEDDDRVFRQITAETGGDPRRMVQRLRAVAPRVALKFEEEWGKARKAQSDAMAAELKVEEEEAKRGGALLQVMNADNYAALLPLVRQSVPELGNALPEVYDKPTVDNLLNYFATNKEMLDRKWDTIKFAQEGKFREALATAFSTADTPEEWAGVQQWAVNQGVPQNEIDLFGAFGPDAQKRAEQLGMTPDERADNAREDARRAFEEGPKFGLELKRQGDTSRYQEGMLRVAQRNAATSERNAGTAAAAERRQATAAKAGEADAVIAAYADAYMAGQPEVIAGKTPTLQGKVEGEVLRRGGKVVPRGVKLPAGLQDKVLSAEQGLNFLDELEAVVQNVETGPVAGRIMTAKKWIPGAAVKPSDADFMSATAKLRNRTIQAITGAAVGVQEEERIKAEIPQETDKPEVWRANAAATRRNLQFLAQRALQINGATPAQVDAWTTGRRQTAAAAAAGDQVVDIEKDPVTGRWGPKKK